MSTQTQIFVNLPVKDLNRSISFYTGLGYTVNPQFTNEQGACIVISDTIYLMILVEEFFQGFTKKQIADAHKTTEVLLCLSAETREGVDELVNKAIAAGGTTPNDSNDHGFMYQWGFQDPDGHLWEVAWMDMSAVPEDMNAEAGNAIA